MKNFARRIANIWETPYIHAVSQCFSISTMKSHVEKQTLPSLLSICFDNAAKLAVVSYLQAEEANTAALFLKMASSQCVKIKIIVGHIKCS